KTIVYAFRIQERLESELSGNDVRMSGNAMLTIVTSRKLMNTATAVTSSTCQRRALRPSSSPSLLCASDPTRSDLRHASDSATVRLDAEARLRGSGLLDRTCARDSR